MSALGQERTSRGLLANVRLVPKAESCSAAKTQAWARFIRTAELRRRQSVIDTNSGRSAHVHTAVAEPSHATWDLLGFGCWRVCAGGSVRRRAHSRRGRRECAALRRASRSNPARSTAEADRAPLGLPPAHRDRCARFILRRVPRCKPGRSGIVETAPVLA